MIRKRVLQSSLFISMGALLFLGCQQGPENPPAPGFNAEGSDAQAITIADQAMKALGGRKNWDHTRFITWKFFGRRFHVWDKQTGNVRVEARNGTVLMNIHTKEGRAWDGGEEVTHPDSLSKRLDGCYRAWVNDSYWLVMPYKLKDSGVTLKFLGERMTADSTMADVLQLTFEGVGVTPQNKYEVFVNKETKMVEQWAYFPKASDEEPRFTGPWLDWEKHGKIMLSANRGRSSHSDIAVFDELPASVFENPEPVDMMSFPKAAQ